jgi:hypothetical protein
MMQMNVKHKSIMIEINRVSFWVQHPPHLINLNIKKTQIAAHTLLLIGYGVEVVNEKMVEFWLVQNSHGKSWGHEGIGKFIMAINGPNGRPLLRTGTNCLPAARCAYQESWREAQEATLLFQQLWLRAHS